MNRRQKTGVKKSFYDRDPWDVTDFVELKRILSEDSEREIQHTKHLKHGPVKNPDAQYARLRLSWRLAICPRITTVSSPVNPLSLTSYHWC